MATDERAPLGESQGDPPQAEPAPGYGATGAYFLERCYEFEKLQKGLDPRLQGAVLRAPMKTLTSAVTSPEDFKKRYPMEIVDDSRGNGNNPWIDVLVRLDDSKPVKEQVEYLRKKGLHIFNMIERVGTGAVRLKDISTVRDNVLSLKAATELRLQLKYSLPAIRCSATDFVNALPACDLNGSDVIIGIVDRGCDFAHRNFRDDSGYTRLLYLWDQRRTAEDVRHLPRGFNYGRTFDAARIDGALLQTEMDPYSFLDYPLAAASHGTHVMDIAAGNGKGTGRPGVAPKADLIFVDLANGDADPFSPGGPLVSLQTQAAQRFGTEEHLGNSRYLLDAVAYIFDKAERLGRPCVVNLSLSTYGGPHDGSTLVEMGFEELLKKPGRAIVISAGNAGEMDIHASGTVAKGRTKSLAWEFEEAAEGEEECEIWYDSDDESKGLIVALKTPDGQKVPMKDKDGVTPAAVKPGETYELKRKLENGKIESCGYVIHRRKDPNHQDGTVNQVNLRLRALKGKAWTIELATEDEGEFVYDAWIDDGRHSSFGESDLESTLGAICCSANTIVVGAFDARMANAVGLAESSLGPTRDGKSKPEVSAPGAGICAARARSHSGLLELSGTSMAAAHVTGLVALLFQLTGPKMGIEEMRRELMKKDPLQSTGWNNPYGYGRVDGVAAALALAPKTKQAVFLQASNGHGNGHGNGYGNGNGNGNGNGAKPAVIELIDPQGNHWQVQMTPSPPR